VNPSDNQHTPAATKPHVGHLKIIGVTIFLVAAGIVIYGISSRANETVALKEWTDAQAIPTVAIVQPSAKAGGMQELVLPGDLQAYFSAPIYARVGGYLKRWYVDIGTHVKAQQLLADIETPDLDQQLEQAKANLETARANEQLASITARRWTKLLATDSVSKQETDEKNGDDIAKKTLVAAATANVERLRALESYKHIVAPFDGTVTARKTDVGSLINAGHDSGPELFTVADIHKLRLYVRVPQSYAAQIKPNMQAQVQVPEYPGKNFTARLVNNSQSVSENSGAILVQLEMDNPNGKLLPGSYAKVQFTLIADPHQVLVPASALIFREKGLQVATVTQSHHIVLRNIQIGHDLGSTVEVVSGLSADDQVVDSPPDSLSEGDEVRIAQSSANTNQKTVSVEEKKL